MSTGDKIKAAAEKAAGQVKETIGNLTNDKDTQAEGKKDQTKGEARETKEDVKDVFKK